MPLMSVFGGLDGLFRGGTAPVASRARPSSSRRASRALGHLTETGLRNEHHDKGHIGFVTAPTGGKASPRGRKSLEDGLLDNSQAFEEDNQYDCQQLNQALRALEHERRASQALRAPKGGDFGDLRLDGVAMPIRRGDAISQDPTAAIPAPKRLHSARVKKVKTDKEKNRRNKSASLASRRRREEEEESLRKEEICWAAPQEPLGRSPQLMGRMTASDLMLRRSDRNSLSTPNLFSERPPSRQRDAFPVHLSRLEDMVAVPKRRVEAFSKVEVCEATQEHIKTTKKTVSEHPRPPSRHKPPSTALFLDLPPSAAGTPEAGISTRSERKQNPGDGRNDDPERDGFACLDASAPVTFQVTVTEGPADSAGGGGFASLFEPASAYSSLTIDTSPTSASGQQQLPQRTRTLSDTDSSRRSGATSSMLVSASPSCCESSSPSPSSPRTSSASPPSLLQEQPCPTTPQTQQELEQHQQQQQQQQQQQPQQQQNQQQAPKRLFQRTSVSVRQQQQQQPQAEAGERRRAKQESPEWALQNWADDEREAEEALARGRGSAGMSSGKWKLQNFCAGFAGPETTDSLFVSSLSEDFLSLFAPSTTEA